MTASSTKLVTESFDYDGGRQVTVSVPSATPTAIVFTGDGQLIAPWGSSLEAADSPPTLVVGVHRNNDETLRLYEYSPNFDASRFAAHERFLIEQVLPWLRSRFKINLRPERTAMFGVSASAELALAMGVLHPDIFGVVLCASPGAGYKPPTFNLPRRAYLVAGKQEPFFFENAVRWAAALRDSGAEVIMTERDGSHGGDFWREEFPLMVQWAFGLE